MIDALAAKVPDLKKDRDELESRAWRIERQAHEARAGADLATDQGLRKILYDKAVSLAAEAATARGELDRAERSLGEHMRELEGLHREARAWQHGERKTDG